MSKQSNAFIMGNIPKLPAKYAAIVMPFFLSGLMSGVVSIINMIKNMGWIDGFFHIWFSSWMLSWLIAFPGVLIVLPLVKKLTAMLVDLPPHA